MDDLVNGIELLDARLWKEAAIALVTIMYEETKSRGFTMNWKAGKTELMAFFSGTGDIQDRAEKSSAMVGRSPSEWKQLELDSAGLRAALTLALCAASSGLAVLLFLNPPAPQANLPCMWKVPEVRFLCSLQDTSPTITSRCEPMGDRQCLCMNAMPIMAPTDSSQIEVYAAAVITQDSAEASAAGRSLAEALGSLRGEGALSEAEAEQVRVHFRSAFAGELARVPELWQLHLRGRLSSYNIGRGTVAMTITEPKVHATGAAFYGLGRLKVAKVNNFGQRGSWIATSWPEEATRPCVVWDFQAGFTECREDVSGRMSRDLFASRPLASRCNASHPLSPTLPPPPALGLPCHQPCQAGFYQEAAVSVRPALRLPSLQVSCRQCQAGRFSLGGGTLLDGSRGDWASPWPGSLRTYCFYRGADARWHAGDEVPKVCMVHLGDLDGEISAEARAALWNVHLPDAGFVYGLVLAPPGNEDLCSPLSPFEQQRMRDKAGRAWAARVAAELADPPLRVPSPRCSEGAWEALNGTGGAEGPSEDPEVVLEMKLVFVRDGHIRFRYAVDAEELYDGLSFFVDEVIVVPRVSWTAEYSEFQVPVLRGPHSFLWVYSKDYSGSAGHDAAKLQLLEVVGSAYADTECRSCEGVAVHGTDDRCLTCGWGQYMDAGTSSCQKCPVGRWSPPGSEGWSSCRLSRPCTIWDYEKTFSSFDIDRRGKRRPVWTGPICRHNMTLVTYSLRKPVTCDKEQDGSERPADDVAPCPPCPGHSSRRIDIVGFQNGECEPVLKPCPSGLHGARELLVDHWDEWPKGFHTAVGAMRTTSRGPADPELVGSGWRRSPDGAAAVIGSAFGGGELEGWGAEASLLHLDVVLEVPGELRFGLEALPASAWSQQASLLVNGSARGALALEAREGRRVTWSTPLGPGPVRLTWVWRHIRRGGHGRGPDSQRDPPPERLGDERQGRGHRSLRAVRRRLRAAVAAGGGVHAVGGALPALPARQGLAQRERSLPVLPSRLGLGARRGLLQPVRPGPPQRRRRLKLQLGGPRKAAQGPPGVERVVSGCGVAGRSPGLLPADHGGGRAVFHRSFRAPCGAWQPVDSGRVRHGLASSGG
ncbi:unnamed protein product [Prorocentrum cordatum]|uniref:Uncharacterized protein n=1 Tax=Prorocentrum cordatum TaxID=2364126 RepID=A0ABN9TPU0_9DINO|nr:unnamed protein product [Polarella glacialis]